MDVSLNGIVVFATNGPQDDIRTLDLASGTVADFLVTPSLSPPSSPTTH